MKTKITDTYANSKMKHFLYGENLHDYQLFIMCSTLIYYNSRAENNIAKNNPNTQPARDKISHAINSSTTIHEMLTALQREFECESLECIYANALLAFNGDDNTLMIRSLNFAGRVLKLQSKSDWLDNWRINAFGTCLSTIMWNKYDSPNNFTVKRKYIPINENIPINYKSFNTFCVGVLREFIIKIGVYPDEEPPKKIDYIKQKLKSSHFTSLTDKEICDECYKHFVYSYIGSHGCNALIDGPETEMQWTATIPEIKIYLKRYPSMIFGGVFNTSAYGQAGQHWMTVMFHNKDVNGDNTDNNNHNDINHPEAVLFCSQGGGWDSFSMSSDILHSLREGSPIPTTYNQVNLQLSDGYSCGNFSIVSNFLMICNNMDIKKTAEDIGKNGKNLGHLVGKDGEIDIYTMRKSLFGVK